MPILKYGGLKTGGVNFDAKVRRESFEPVDLFYAHIGGMDAFARGLKIAAAIRKDGRLAEFVKQRYSSWDSGIGAKIESGKANFEGARSLHAQERRSRRRTSAAARNSWKTSSTSLFKPGATTRPALPA